MFFTLAFAAWRLPEIITLFPIAGTLGWFAIGYAHYNTPMPDSVLFLFVASVLALVWALATFIIYGFIKRNALLTGCIDFCFAIIFIAVVRELHGIISIAMTDCSLFPIVVLSSSFRPLGYGGNIVGNCHMLKACFALAIVNMIFFFYTTVCIGALPTFLSGLC